MCPIENGRMLHEAYCKRKCRRQGSPTLLSTPEYCSESRSFAVGLCKAIHTRTKKEMTVEIILSQNGAERGRLDH